MATGLVSVFFGFVAYFILVVLLVLLSYPFFPNVSEWLRRISAIAIFPSFILAGVFLVTVGNPNCSVASPLSCLSLQAPWPLYGDFTIRSKWVLEPPFTYSISASVFSILGTMVEGVAVGAWVGTLQLLVVPGMVLVVTKLYPAFSKAKAWMIGRTVNPSILQADPSSQGQDTFGGVSRLFLWIVVLVFFAPLYFSQVFDVASLLSYSMALVPVLISLAWVSEAAGLGFVRDGSVSPVGPLVFSTIAGAFGILTLLQILAGVPQRTGSIYVDESFAMYFASLGFTIAMYYARPLLTRSVEWLIAVKASRRRVAVHSATIVPSLVLWVLLITDPQVMGTWSSAVNPIYLGLFLLAWLALVPTIRKVLERNRPEPARGNIGEVRDLWIVPKSLGETS
jgi:hypothetical protein